MWNVDVLYSGNPAAEDVRVLRVLLDRLGASHGLRRDERAGAVPDDARPEACKLTSWQISTEIHRKVIDLRR